MINLVGNHDQYLVLDFYVDEPACFGVPPYVSPYVRYTYGALLHADSTNEVDYLTIDHLRESEFRLNKTYVGIFLVGGSSVPGKYLGSRIGTLAEILTFLDRNPNQPIFLGGPIKFISEKFKSVIQSKGGILCSPDISDVAYQFSTKKDIQKINTQFKVRKDYSLIREFAIKGAGVMVLHFRFPHLIAEIETYQGCTRNVFCSFCTEALYGRPVFRPLEDILSEVEALQLCGISNFRIGRQADLYTYMADMDDFKNTFPRPRPAFLKDLYKGIRSVAPDTQVLHLDNVNPGLLATFPKEAEEITEIITSYNTELDTAAMGMETADEQVIIRNSLKATPKEVATAIDIIHKYGVQKNGSLPKLTVGLNFIHGLPGETKDTFRKNYDFLASLLDKGIFLRRINIRQVLVFENTGLERLRRTEKHIQSNTILKYRFHYYKKLIREKIDPVMLAGTFPIGSIIKDVYIEKQVANGFLGRPIGSYPITCYILSSDTLEKTINFDPNILRSSHYKTDVLVIGYKSRSLLGISLQDKLSYLPLHLLEKILPKKIAFSFWETHNIQLLPKHLVLLN